MKRGMVLDSMREIFYKIPQDYGVVVVRITHRKYLIFGHPLSCQDDKLNSNLEGATVMYFGKAFKMLKRGRIEIRRHPHPKAVWS